MNPRARIARVSFTTADPDGTEAFYRSALGFERVASTACQGRHVAELVGVACDECRATVLRLGHEEISLLAFAQPGQPYPSRRASNDPWFQHIAVVVSDMAAAYARLSAHDGWSPITRHGPQQLPAASGGVTAFKFRDPEGHPLELLAFPKNTAPSVWRRSDALFLGIDHSAIAVADTARSLGFYERLGFSIRSQTLNRGLEQDNLDGLDGTTVEVTGLHLPEAPRPNLELLRYRAPTARVGPVTFAGNDVAATRLEVEVADLEAAIGDLRAADAAFVSAGGVSLGDGRTAALARDPDGHHVLFRTAA